MFFLFLAVALVVHLKFTPYFHWDEWHLLQKFLEHGYAAAFQPHNEHFKPIFLILYFIEAQLFGDRYVAFVFVSLVFHTINALLLRSLLRRLIPGSNGDHAALLLSGMFLISALHSEIAQWAFALCVLMVNTALLISLISVCDYWRTGKRKYLIAIGLAALLGPLMLGSGFTITLFVGLLSLYLFVSSAVSPAQSPSLRQKIPSFFSILAASAAGTFVTLFVYSQVGAGSTETHTLSDLWLNRAEIVRYFGVGTQLGTILRGSGLFPALDPIQAQALLPSFVVPENVGLFFVSLGYVVSLVILLLTLILTDERKQSLLLYLLGQGFIAAAFIVPSLGRYRWGSEQAFSLRYQYSALFGLCIMCLPLATTLFERWRAGSMTAISRALVVAYLTIFLGTNLYLNFSWDYFTEKGRHNRKYINRLCAWSTKLTTRPAPNVPPMLAPNLKPEAVLAIVRGLDAQRCVKAHRPTQLP